MSEEITAAIRVLDALSELLGDQKSLSFARAYLHIVRAGTPGLPMAVLEKAADVSSSAVSRIVQEMGPRGWLKTGEGLDIVEKFVDPNDERTKIVRLNANGIKSLRAITKAAKGLS